MRIQAKRKKVTFAPRRKVGLREVEKALIIDDDKLFCLALSDIVQSHDLQCLVAHSLQEGMHIAANSHVALVFLDIQLPDGNGLSIIRELKRLPSFPEVIIITNATDHKGASAAIKDGAWDYIVKCESIKNIQMSFLRALEKHRNRSSAVPLHLDGVFGSSQRIQDCIHQLEQASRSDSNVLITGETGTGKELFARAVHGSSRRAGKNFVIVDCAALHQTVMASDLFGYVKGAFTGALVNRAGLVEQADGGTLFLDEVSELSPDMQKSFLRVIESRSYRPLGASHERESDFRLVCACNRDLQAMTEQGSFRKDLYYRIKSITIELPPLCERAEDIPAIAEYHVDKICAKNGWIPKAISRDLMRMFMQYNWPGNVRELVNTLYALCASAAKDDIILPSHLPRDIHYQLTYSVEHGCSTDMLNEKSCTDMDLSFYNLPWREYRIKALDKIEMLYLENLMNRCRGRMQTAIRYSGLSQARLYELLKKHGIFRGRLY